MWWHRLVHVGTTPCLSAFPATPPHHPPAASSLQGRWLNQDGSAGVVKSGTGWPVWAWLLNRDWWGLKEWWGWGLVRGRSNRIKSFFTFQKVNISVVNITSWGHYNVTLCTGDVSSKRLENRNIIAWSLKIIGRVLTTLVLFASRQLWQSPNLYVLSCCCAA